MISWLFLLTRPLRGATFDDLYLWESNYNFYSHAPCGARLIHLLYVALDSSFLLTRPLRGATSLRRTAAAKKHISTHTPLAGRDIFPPPKLLFPKHFYSHAPCGARHSAAPTLSADWIISTHTPLAGRDMKIKCAVYDCYISTHTPLAGRDR